MSISTHEADVIGAEASFIQRAPAVASSASNRSTPNIVVEMMTTGVSTATVRTALSSLNMAREAWESTELAASHARLYEILSNGYAFYLQMKSKDITEGQRAILRDGLLAYLESRGIAAPKNTHDMNHVMKAIFGDDRRRVSAYSVALRFALVDGPVVQGVATPVPPAELHSWIASKGGIEKARQAKSAPTGPSKEARVADTVTALKNSKALGTFKPDPRSMPFGLEDTDKQSVLVVTYKANGELDINCVVKHDAVVRIALDAYYTAHKDQIKQSLASAGNASEGLPAPETALAKALNIAAGASVAN